MYELLCLLLRGKADILFRSMGFHLALGFASNTGLVSMLSQSLGIYLAAPEKWAQGSHFPDENSEMQGCFVFHLLCPKVLMVNV